MSTNSHQHKRDFLVDPRLLKIGGIAIGIGACSTVAAWVLLKLIHLFTNLFFFQKLSFAFHSPSTNHLGLGVIFLPVLGGLAVGLIARFGSEKIRGHGIPEAIEAILFGQSKMSGKVALLKPIASGIAIGSGGPFGAEGPIIMTGGAIGSLIAQHFHLSSAERKTLLVAGATAGMTAVFGTPVAAVLLAVELLLFELRPRSLLPVIVACSVAGFGRPLLMDAAPLFALETAPVAITTLLSCVLAGVLGGALAAVMSTMLYRVEDLFHQLPVHWMWWPAIGGLAVGIGGYFEPRALGVGYDVIGDLLNNRLALHLAAGLLLVKAMIWVIALGSGTSGGVLAPLLIIGAGLGTLLAPWLPGNDAALWPLACMAAVLAGTLGAPLTAAIFALELTQDINALLPLLLTTAVAYGFTVMTMKRSIMTEKISRRGYHIFREYSVDPLERQHVGDVMSHHVTTISAQLTLPATREQFFGNKQTYRSYPVVDDTNRLLGMIDRSSFHASDNDDQTLSVLFPAAQKNAAPAALPTETCKVIAARMASLQLQCLPVIDHLHSQRVIGIISRSDLIQLSQNYFDEEQNRQRLI